MLVFKGYHAPQKHDLPKNATRIIFEIGVAQFELVRTNFKKLTRYPLYCCGLHDITRLRPLSLSIFYYRYPIRNLPS